MKIDFSKGLAVTIACFVGVVIAVQFLLFLKLQTLQKEIAALQSQNTGFELLLPEDSTQGFPPNTSQNVSPTELTNTEASHSFELLPPGKLKGTEKAKPISLANEKLKAGQSLLTEEEKQKIWQETFRELDAKSVKDLRKMRNAIERTSQRKKN